MRSCIALLSGFALMSLVSSARADDLVHVRLVDPHGGSLREDVQLEREVGPNDYEVRCESPCQEATVAEGRYRVSGPDTKASSVFDLHEDSAFVSVERGRRGPWIAGVVLSSVGGGFALLGAAMVAEPIQGDGRGSAQLGGIMIGAGLGMGIAGLLLLLGHHRSTDVTVVSRGETIVKPHHVSETPSHDRFSN
jgi:hypothetical protein